MSFVLRPDQPPGAPAAAAATPPAAPQPEPDYYREGENLVFTATFLRRRGYCCESGCRHCPYGFRAHK